MDTRILPHVDERLGHVAFDMGLLTAEQVAETKKRVVQIKTATGESVTFGKTALEMGYLDAAQLEAVENEELRRRRLITGYEIIDILGTGNVATVYRARQLAMDRDVALKILHPRLASDPVFVRAYIAEAQAVSRFHHPNIVQGFDAGESNGFFYFAHEYLSGGSIADRLGETFSETRMLTYLRQTTAALKHAWAVAVYHGDINPGNLLLDGNGVIKLANLGVPRVAALRSASDGARKPGFIRCGPEYAAPEQLERPDTVNARTDIYSLGATFYHISFGVPPFPGDDRKKILEYRQDAPMPSFSLKSQENFSGKYLRLLHDMLEVDPEKRPSDPEELADRLEMFHVADGEEAAARHPAVPAGTPATSQRMPMRCSAPNPDGCERGFSLHLRTRNLRPGPPLWWLALAGAAAAATVIAWVLLRGPL